MGGAEEGTRSSNKPQSSRRLLLSALRALRTCVLALLMTWTVLAIYYSNIPWRGLRGVMALLFAAATIWSAVFLRKRIRIYRWVLASFLCVLLWWLAISPSNDRDWARDQATLSLVDFDEDAVTIRNIRNFAYRTTDDYVPHTYDRTFDLGKLKTLDFVLEHFGGAPGAAHTFLTFGFEDGSHVAISIEIRKEKGEIFNPLSALFKQFELMYVIGDERDLIGLRTNHRHDDVYLYPVRASRENMRAMFVDMLRRTNHLATHPEYYNTLTNTCTTNIVEHINHLATRQVGFSLKVLFPAYSDRLAYDLGLIDTDLPLDELRARCRINEAAERHRDSADFSSAIREHATRLRIQKEGAR